MADQERQIADIIEEMDAVVAALGRAGKKPERRQLLRELRILLLEIDIEFGFYPLLFTADASPHAGAHPMIR